MTNLGQKTVMVVGSPRVLGFSSGLEPTYSEVLERVGYQVVNPESPQDALNAIEIGQYIDLLITGWEGSMKLLRHVNQLQSGSMKNHGPKYVITGQGDASGPLAGRFRNTLQTEGIEFTYLPQASADGLLRKVEHLINQQPLSI